jgi:stalled ribosome rescue protein Dom34
MKCAGLWIDHKKAVVSIWSQNKGITEKVLSGLSPLDKAKRTSRVAPKKHEARREQLIMKFYGDVLKTIRSTDKVFLMGPGIAKKEFKVFLTQKGFSGKIVNVASADKMTERQIAAETKNFFKLGDS